MKVKTLSWILPLAVIIGAILDAALVYVFMKFTHPWKYLLSEKFHKKNNETEEHGLCKKSESNTTIQLSPQLSQCKSPNCIYCDLVEAPKTLKKDDDTSNLNE